MQRDREREERRAAEIYQNLERYKREIGEQFLCGLRQLSDSLNRDEAGSGNDVIFARPLCGRGGEGREATKRLVRIALH